MAVSNLTGYTWIGNSDIHNPKEAENITWNISGNFDFGGGGASGSFTLLNYVVMNIFQDRYLVELRYDNNMSLYSAGWNGPNPVTIVFTGGDVTNAILITWLEANGTLTPPVVTNGAMYLGTSSISKMYIGNVEVSKVYLGQDLVYEKQTPSGYTVSGGAMAVFQDDCFQYSTDGGTTWNDFEIDDSTANITPINTTQIQFRVKNGNDTIRRRITSTILDLNLSTNLSTYTSSSNFTLTQNVNDLILGAQF